MLQRRQNLDDPCYPSRAFEVADVRLDRPYAAASGIDPCARFLSPNAKCRLETRDLDWIAKRSPRTMRLDIADAVWARACFAVHFGDQLRLRRGVGHGQRTRAAAVIGANAGDDGMYGVAIGAGPREWLE